MALPNETPVVIVGGALIGLTSSLLLSYYGIDHILFERHPGTSIYPKAVSINQRSTEIFDKVGVLTEIIAQAAPPKTCRRNGYYTNVGAEGREIGSRSGFGSGIYATAYAKASPTPYINLAQIRLEPILKRRAEELNPRGICFSHEVQSLEEQSNGIVISYRTPTGAVRTTVAQYVVGADGGRFLGKSLGIEWEGQTDLIDLVTVHMRSPLSERHPDPTVLISWLLEPRMGGSLNTGAFYHLGPYPLQRETEEWAFVFARLPAERRRHLTQDEVLSRVRKSLDLPDLPIEIISVNYWHVHGRVASRFRSAGGRVFLVGDAARSCPPFGALGANTGIQDVDNLTWKLAFVFKHPKTNLEHLLDSYEAERKAIAHAVVDKTLANMFALAGGMDNALGISPAAEPEVNVRRVEQFFDMADTGEGAEKREKVTKQLSLLDNELYAHGNEVGWFYDNSHFQRGDFAWKSPQIMENGLVDQNNYHPCTVPGHNLPHAWLYNSHEKQRRSTRHFVEKTMLVLLASSPSWAVVNNPWIKVVCIDDSAWTDVDGTWTKQCQVSPSGAVLVRPDNIVAYRWKDDAILQGDFNSEMAKIVQQVLLIEEGV